MPTDEPQVTPFRIGDWLVEPGLGRVSRGSEVVQLELKVMDVLVCLACHAGELVTRQQIVDEVWQTEFISDNTLTHAIAELRQALGDDARHPAYIETLHRRGYRLLSPVTELEPKVDAAREAVPRFKLLTAAGEACLSEGENLIGRAHDALISIDSPKVSRHHARVMVEGPTATLEDLGSKNGTFLNGERIEAHAVLVDGDEIRIGRDVARFRFVVVGERTVTEMSVEGTS